jgi:periplasmic serine protease, Do/DeqQ family
MKKIRFIIATTALLLLSHSALAALPYASPQQGTPSLAPMLQKIMPAVVNIKVEGTIQTNPGGLANEDENDKPGVGRNALPHRFQGLGSGVIVDAGHGYVITNAHVIREAKTIKVMLSDGRTFKANLIGADVPSDVALLQIKASGLTELRWGNSDQLKVGDFVAAIGNPFGLNQTVTSGIISALERSNLGIEGYENFIQTDASINPGNSGGALINLKGELIGVNTAILGPAGGSIGIGFAIPANMARSVMVQLIKYGSVRRGLMGVLVQDLTPELAGAFHFSLKTSGALVTMVTPSSPAEKAGFKAGDVILAVNGEPVINASQVKNRVGLLRVGANVSLTVLRAGKTTTLKLVTQDPEQYQHVNEAKNPFLYGTILKHFDQQLPAQGHVIGILVLHVTENTAAWHGGLRPGDVIVSANQQPTATLTQLDTVSRAASKQLLLNVLRLNGALFVVINR